MKTILITGASGFLADKIFDTLDSLKKYHIIMGARNTSKLTDVLKYYDIRKFNVSDENTYEDALLDIDVVIHLAAMDYSDCEKNPELANKVNVLDLEKFYKKCQLSGVKQFVYFSTIHVYGPNLSGIITEETPPNPINTYSQTHFEAEKIVLNNKSGFVVRLSNTIGHATEINSSAWKLIANDLCLQAVKRKSMKINSSGKQLRDFISSSNIGNAIEVLLNQNHENFGNNIFNVGSGQTISILDLAKIIQEKYDELFGFKPPISRIEIPNENYPTFTFSTHKISQLGFNNSLEIKQEISKILKSIRDQC
jgi:UDP-glucose 4-epimerase